MLTGGPHGSLNTLTLIDAEDQSVRFECAEVALFPSLVGRNMWSLVNVVKTIRRAALVPKQPSAAAPEGNQISEREIGIVPH
jgi:hypothetical protein